ncbi:hypothetical protein [Cellvibrio sp. QJXJ]|uniref:hypothetical protein n=1 Tax=Cellvibrio sp. QJXJ TaxID=2964606 RepID=UPI0021C49382|nr:hypothetical protein [Cellvibrio sp. QJXJ]UUA75190.1 hypothetical protein NNX04_22290 [Cellvibrio sp. QJXJ]
MSHETLSFCDGKLVICNLTAYQVLQTYPGMTRFKPHTYFGREFERIEQFHQLDSAISRNAWYTNFSKVYSHYWSEKPGRFNYYESHTTNRKSKLSSAIIESTIPASYSLCLDDGDGVLVGLKVPAVELFRRAACLPLIDSPLFVSPASPSGASIHFYQIDIHDISYDALRVYGLLEREKEGAVWLSSFEMTGLGLSAIPRNVAFTKTVYPKPPIPVRVDIADWEYLSHSVEDAHIARLAGVIDLFGRKPNQFGLLVAGAINAILSMRFKEIVSALPFDVKVTRNMNEIFFVIGRQHVNRILQLAYRVRVLPCIPVEMVGMPWNRESTAFDALFESYLKGRISELNNWNLMALKRGGINA